MYTEEMLESIKKVEAKRAENAAMEPRRMTAEEKDQVLKENHPDYREDQFDVLSVGPNKGEKAPKELVKMLQSDSRLKDNLPDLSCPDYETDVLIIGGGGAGASAAIEADNAGEKVMIVTKLRIGAASRLRTSRTTLRHSTSWTALAAVTLLRIRNWFTSWLPRLRTAFSGSRIWALSSTRTQKAT